MDLHFAESQPPIRHPERSAKCAAKEPVLSEAEETCTLPKANHQSVILSGGRSPQSKDLHFV
jgi:hypothetical protein